MKIERLGNFGGSKTRIGRYLAGNDAARDWILRWEWLTGKIQFDVSLYKYQ